MRSTTLCALLIFTALIHTPRISRGDVSPATARALRTPLTARMLDRAAFTVWVDGRDTTTGLPPRGPEHVIWTQNSAVEWNGVDFGDSKTAGTRYLRIGFTAPVAVGTVLVRAGGQLSVLKSSAAYPGRMNDDADWLPAQRLVGSGVGTGEVGGEEYAAWILPPGTKTRALRFAHTAAPTDRRYAGWLGGVYVLTDRLANVAPQAQAVTRANPEKADRINDSSSNSIWNAWDNIARDTAPPGDRSEPVSATHPEDVMLVWPRPVTLQGLCALWAGFTSADAQTYIGGGDPRAADDSQWKTIGSYSNIDAQYPRALGVNGLDFGQTVTTRAIRLRILQPTAENHPHLVGSTLGGRRVWLGELLAMQPLTAGSLTAAILPRPAAVAAHPPIAIPMRLASPGYVTLVIEDAHGRRVRNLISAAYFPTAGPQTVWWDGMDDLGRDTEAARHGIYSAPGQFVPPGTYRVRGLVRPHLDLRYEFSVYNAGHPAWETADHTGGWLTNHTPPGCTLFVPGDHAPGGKPLVFIGSYVSEGGDGLAWVDLEGRKQGGRGWIGGAWTGAQFLARDAGTAAAPEIYAYVAAAWESDQDKNRGEIRLTGLTPGGDRAVLKYGFAPGANLPHDWGGELGGLAVHNGLLVFSLPRRSLLVMVDVKTGKVVGEAPLAAPRGLAFDANGALLALSETRLLRISAPTAEAFAAGMVKTETVIAAGLEAPAGITLDKSGNIYVSDQGASHQVKVFSSDGKPLRTIGKPGAPRAGSYDPDHMNNPKGLAIDDRDQLWVAEEDFQPKRVSVWSLDGRRLRDFYGPGQYGGGGTLDPKDRTRFYYTGMEFKLDWRKGTDRLVNVFYRPGPGEFKGPDGYGADGRPETPIYAHGAQYMTNANDSNPTNGPSIVTLWQMRNGLARPVAALGRANEWSLLKTEPFRSRWPRGVDLTGEAFRNPALFVWCDRNGDGQVQPDEVTFRRAQTGGVTVMPDLSFVAARVDDRAMRYAPLGYTAQGVPLYDLDEGQPVATAVQGPVSSGGDQALLSPDGWTIITNAPAPFSPYGVGGVKNGKALWTYPSLWPGLHASHESPAPDRPGELIGTTRLLGGVVTPRGGEAGPIWAVNGNMGPIYLLTSDGLFVAQLFQDVRQGQTWSMPVGARGMNLNGLTLHDENFWPTITQTTEDGRIYLVDGARTSLVRIDGLDGVKRLPSTPITITAADLQRAREAAIRSEAERQSASGPRLLHVALRSTPPAMDGTLDDWKDAEWATIDKRGVAAWFNSDSKPYDVKAAVAIAGDRLYAAFHTGDKDLLRNSGETPNALFKTGGALDLMLGANPAADPKRRSAAAGDVRLLVTRVGGKPRALLYRAVVPGTKEPVGFRSPSRGITIDRVDDVTDQVQLAADDKGDYTLSIPLATLGLNPRAGQTLRGDIGVLRGNGFQTLQRVYWSNKATGITADVPSEAELTPQLWGDWQIIAAP